jgi:uncharacterized membrane protein YkvA (DUF1232 family)
MAKHVDKMKSWIDSFTADVAAIEALVESEQVPRDARLAGAAALNYLVTRLDLIPDWEETCGILDDAMVLRVAMAEAMERDLDALPVDALKTVARLANEADAVRQFLGEELYAKLKRYVHELTSVIVRGRHPRVIVEDEKERAQLLAEVRDDLKRLPPAPMTDPDRVERVVKNTLQQKLR